MTSMKLVPAAVATFAVLALGSWCVADASPGAAQRTAPGTALAAYAATAHHGDNAHLTAYTDNDGPVETVIVTGVIGDYGQAVSVYPDGAVDPDHDSQLSLRLQRGTFRLDVAALDKSFVAAVLQGLPGNAATCSGTVEVTGRVPVVAGSGTGAYKGVGGAFTLTITLDEVDKAIAGEPCTAGSAFLDQAIVTTGPGTVTF